MYITAPAGLKDLARYILPDSEYKRLEEEDFNVYGEEKSLQIIQALRDLGWITLNFEEFDKISVKPSTLGLEIFEGGLTKKYLEKNGELLGLLKRYLQFITEGGDIPAEEIEALADHFLKAGNYTRVIDFSSMLISIGTRDGIPKVIGIGHYYYGSVNIYKMELDFVKAHYEKAISYSEKADDIKNLARSYLGLASYYGYKGKIDESMRIFEKCYLLYREIGDESGINNVRMNEAYAYALKGDFQNFFKLNHESMDYFEKSKDLTHLQYCYQNEASILLNIGEYDMAIEASSEAYSISTKTGNERVKHLSGLAIATIYISTKRPGDAFNYINDAFEYFRKNIDTNGMANCYMLYMEYYIATHNQKEAETYMKKAEQHFMSKKSLTFIAGTYFEFIKAMRNYEYSDKEVKTKILEFRNKATSLGVEKTLEQYLEEI
jgi:tetratricopeptide (TPR) repeat protein